MNKLLPVVAAAMVAGVAAAQDPGPLMVRAVMIDQVCIDADTVEVHLSAETNSDHPVLYTWDTDHDGTFDVAPSENPDLALRMSDETRAGVVLGARDKSGSRAGDRIEFPTRRCD